MRTPTTPETWAAKQADDLKRHCTRNPNSCKRDEPIPGDPIPHCGDTGGECPHEPRPTK